MRAALEGILKRFDPAQLEAKLTQRSMLASLIPAKRKAGMWDVFTQLYGQISAEASDDFHELFGKEFLRAYNEHIDQLAGTDHDPGETSIRRVSGRGRGLSVQMELATLCPARRPQLQRGRCGHWHSDNHLCCVVADGAGGHGGGDKASKLAVQYILGAFAALPKSSPEAIERMIVDANRSIIQHRADDRACRTCTAQWSPCSWTSTTTSAPGAMR
jgi:hypothetical protein